MYFEAFLQRLMLLGWRCECSGVRPRAKWIVCFNDKQQMSGDVSSEEESPQPNTVASQQGAYHY